MESVIIEVVLIFLSATFGYGAKSIRTKSELLKNLEFESMCSSNQKPVREAMDKTIMVIRDVKTDLAVIVESGKDLNRRLESIEQAPVHNGCFEALSKSVAETNQMLRGILDDRMVQAVPNEAKEQPSL